MPSKRKKFNARFPTAAKRHRPGALTTGSRNTTVTSQKSKPPRKKKIRAWDTKARLKALESREHLTVTRIKALEDTNQTLEREKSQIVAEKENMRTESVAEFSKLEGEFSQLRSKLEEEKALVRSYEKRADVNNRRIAEPTAENSQLECKVEEVERRRRILNNDLEASQQEVASLKKGLAQLACVRGELEEMTSQCKTLKGTVADRDKVIEKRDSELAECKSNLREEETMRRNLHNTIQELKGNVRVFCRVRPLLGKEKVNGGDEPDSVTGGHMAFPSSKALELRKPDSDADDSSMSQRSTAKGSTGETGKTEFNFDYVFSPSSSQSHVFEEISQLVQSALDGYNVSIFAYGQTGSGKTYTMQGPPKDEVDDESEGMIPRSMRQVFETAQHLQEKGWKYDMEASFLEIYNETIHDLLGPADPEKKPKIVDGVASNITTIKVTSQEQVHRKMQKAMGNRAVAETKCNERSSRSHCVFTLKITGTNSATSEKRAGSLHLIDLAGSERLKVSGAEGARLKETKAINSSLSALSTCILAISRQASHVPYRDSKLTHLLQSALGGNSKTLMFVNLSPNEDNYSETLNSLRFATQVKNCQIGTAKKNPAAKK